MTTPRSALLTAVTWIVPALAPASLRPEAVEIGHVSFEVGERIEVRSELGFALDVRLESAGESLPGFELASERQREKTIAILAEGSEGPDEISVEYHRVEGTDHGPEGESQEESPLDGQTFRVARDAAALVVTDGDGAEVDDEVAELVVAEEGADDGGLLRGLRVLSRALPGGRLVAGKEIEVDEEIAIELLDDEDVIESADMSLRLAGTREEDGVRCAVLAVEISASGEADGDVEVSIELEGELLLAIDTGRAVALDLEGTIAIDGEADEPGEVELSGEGRMQLSLRVAYDSGR